jgi:hypothetical protein
MELQSRIWPCNEKKWRCKPENGVVMKKNGDAGQEMKM